jgi:hypothetical protein
MPSYKELSVKIKELGKLVTGKTVPRIPDGVLAESLEKVTSVLSRLQVHFPPTPQEKRAAKAHSISAQIINFTTINPERKRFFQADYFRKKFQALPADRQLVAASTPATAPAIRDAIVLYYFRQGHASGYKELASFWHEIEVDYKDSPSVRKTSQANELLKQLLAKEELEAICATLRQQYPTEADLKEFAKLTKLKIPAQSRSRGVLKKSAHERLAEQIYAQGGVVRLRLD